MKLKAYFKANPTDDLALRRKRHTAIYAKHAEEIYGVGALSIASLEALLAETTIVKTDKGDVECCKVSCLELRSYMSNLLNQRKNAARAALRVQTFKEASAAFAAAGYPTDWVTEADGRLALQNPAELGGG